jgi:hypothetical protein
MIEFLTPATPDWKVTKYPGGALNTSSKGWLVPDLDR